MTKTKDITKYALCVGDKIVRRDAVVYVPVTSTIGFLSRLSHPNLITSRLKDKCSEYEKHLPSNAVHSALQKKTKEDARNENGKSKIFCVKLIRLYLCVIAGLS